MISIPKIIFASFTLTSICYACLNSAPQKTVTPKKSVLSNLNTDTKESHHEAFLGKNKADELDHLPEDESLKRLVAIAEQADANGNGKITLTEMQEWLRFTHAQYITDDANKQFADVRSRFSDRMSRDDAISWTEYKQSSYGFLGNEMYEYTSEEEIDFRQMLARDEKRWAAADVDGDGFCTKKEFQAFINPQDYDHTKETFAAEMLEQVDKNKDGFLDFNEYVTDVYGKEDLKQRSDVVESERKLFEEIRDQNKDGRLDFKEVYDWVFPKDYDPTDGEAHYLLKEADDNADGELSIDEILMHHDTFAGSQLTNWGDSLKHDEM